MRIGLIPEGMGEKMAMNPNLLPEPFFVSQWGMLVSRAVITAVKQGIFDLVSTPRTSAEISITRNCDDMAMTAFLDFLVSAGYLAKKKGMYSNTELSKKWLNRESEFSIADAVLLLDEYWKEISSMDSILRKGVKKREMTARTAELHMRGNAVFAKYRAKEICAKIKLKKPAKMLDVGGGHCMYSMEMCSRYPGLKAEVIELTDIAQVAKEIVEENGMADKVLFRTGDLRTIDWGHNYDAVFMFSILGALEREEANKTLKSAHNAVKVGGTVAILEPEYVDNPGFPESIEHMMYFLDNGRPPFKLDVLKKMMADAGFKSISAARVGQIQAVLVTGKR